MNGAENRRLWHFRGIVERDLDLGGLAWLDIHRRGLAWSLAVYPQRRARRRLRHSVVLTRGVEHGRDVHGRLVDIAEGYRPVLSRRALLADGHSFTLHEIRRIKQEHDDVMLVIDGPCACVIQLYLQGARFRSFGGSFVLSHGGGGRQDKGGEGQTRSKAHAYASPCRRERTYRGIRSSPFSARSSG